MLPKFSIIIPVYKEEKLINNTIKYIKSLKYINKAEIIIVDGDQKKRTIDHIHDSNVIKISSIKERGIQLNAGAKIAKGEILIFLHVDTELPYKALEIINNIIKEKGYKVGAFNLSIDSKKIIYRIIGFNSSGEFARDSYRLIVVSFTSTIPLRDLTTKSPALLCHD